MGRAIHILLVVFLLAATREGWAGEPEADSPDNQPATAEVKAYQRHLEIGVRLYEDRNYDAAMAEFERAYAKQKRAAPLINIALCHKGQFAYTKAIAKLEQALREHRDTVRNPEEIEKGIREMKELLGTLHVRLRPAAAWDTVRLTLDGEAVPTKAARGAFDVSPGKHELVISAVGFAAQHHAFRIASGEARRLDVTLVIDRGTLLFEASGETKIAVDGAPRGAGKTKLQLSPGTHLLEASRDEDQYTVSFAIVQGKTTRISLDEDGLLRVGENAPRGPDLTAKPPVRGIYMLAVLDVGPRVGGFTDLRVAPGLRLGYRIMSEVAVELEFHQALNVSETNEQDALVGSTVGRANVRFMTTTMPVRFVTTVGAGYAHDFDGEGSGNGVNFLAEPGFDVELSQFIFGLAAPVVVSFSSLSGSAVSFDFGGGLRAGYGFWW